MRNQILETVALRYRALYLDVKREDVDLTSEVTAPVLAFVARIKETGFCVSEELLHALCKVDAGNLVDITGVINEIMGVNLNWAPLVKGWNVPTGESALDHLVTLFANWLGGEKAGFEGTTLPCGHFIPERSFPLERYNGCPFCGKQFKTADYVYKGQASKLRELRLFTEVEMREILDSLLTSTVPLDGTQRNTLEQLLGVYGLPVGVDIKMKETLMFVIKDLVKHDLAEQARPLFKTPTDILRYLWFEKTGLLQIVEPRTLIARSAVLYRHMFGPLDRKMEAADQMRDKLKLKYTRKECKCVAGWLNELPLTAEKAAEIMNPKRGMWVRVIRALRLGEYSRRDGYERLARILDVFYKHEYDTWQGRLEVARNDNDASVTLGMLKQRPGLFARCLFSTMLRFGAERTLAAFNEIADEIPARLLLSLANGSRYYFDPNATRIVRPILGGRKQVPINKLMCLYSDDDLKQMSEDVVRMYKVSMSRRYSAMGGTAKTMFIDPMLYNIPFGVGDRTDTVQDMSCALMGTKFPVEGESVRLFMQWGKGLHAMHLDMDLSCRIALPDNKKEECTYYNLVATGAKHSGDIRSIPEMVGTAEYIELNLPELEAHKVKYATFTCNAYSVGALSPNLVVGWMSSENPMTISEETGVAYDPSCVQHMVRVRDNSLAKGLVFGVLDVEKREIIWLEMPYEWQTIKGCDSESVEALLRNLSAKVSVGELLEEKAKGQGVTIVADVDSADEKYTYEWALNPAEVSKLLDV